MITVVRQQTASDCGVAALAMALGASYDFAAAHAACWVYFPQVCKGERKAGYMGLTLDDMRLVVARALRLHAGKEPRETGVAPQKRGTGVVFCHVDGGCWGSRHWLAWYVDASGGVQCVNPSDGETWALSKIHSKGMRPCVFLYVKEGR